MPGPVSECPAEDKKLTARLEEETGYREQAFAEEIAVDAEQARPFPSATRLPNLNMDRFDSSRCLYKSVVVEEHPGSVTEIVVFVSIATRMLPQSLQLSGSIFPGSWVIECPGYSR